MRNSLLLLSCVLFFTQFGFSQCMTTGDFESPEWTTHSSGNWTQSTSEGTWEGNSAYVNTGSVHGGSNKFGMNATGDYLITPQYTDPATLQFWVRTSSDPDDWTLDIQYSTSNTGPWTTHSSVIENGTGGTVTNTYTQISVNLNLTGNYYIRFFISSRSAGSCYLDDISLTCGSPCTTADDVTSAIATAGLNQATISWVAPSCFEEFMVVGVENSSVSVSPSGDGSAYTDNTTFGSGTDLGTSEYDCYEGSATSVTVTNLTAGTNYCFRIFTRTGTTWNSGIEVCVTPLDASQVSYVNGTLVNSCGTSAEGTNEMATIQVGAADLHWDDISITFPNGGTYCNSCGNTWTTNSTYVNNNLEPDCPSENLIFEVGVDGNTVPAGERLIIFSGSPPSYDFDFSGLCGSGPIYVMFADNTSTTGRFANAANADRTLTYNLAGYTGSVTYYSSTANTGTDGDFVSYDINGNPSYHNQCTPEAIIVLDNNQIRLKASGRERSAKLHWYFSKEEAGIRYELFGSSNGTDWTSLTNTSRTSFDHEDVKENIQYYKVMGYMNDKVVQSNIASVKFNQEGFHVYPNPATDLVMIDAKDLGIVSIINLEGQVIKTILKNTEGTMSIDLRDLATGLYVVQFTTDLSTLTSKLKIK